MLIHAPGAVAAKSSVHSSYLTFPEDNTGEYRILRYELAVLTLHDGDLPDTAATHSTKGLRKRDAHRVVIHDRDIQIVEIPCTEALLKSSKP